MLSPQSEKHSAVTTRNRGTGNRPKPRSDFCSSVTCVLAQRPRDGRTDSPAPPSRGAPPQAPAAAVFIFWAREALSGLALASTGQSAETCCAGRVQADGGGRGGDAGSVRLRHAPPRHPRGQPRSLRQRPGRRQGPLRRERRGARPGRRPVSCCSCPSAWNCCPSRVVSWCRSARHGASVRLPGFAVPHSVVSWCRSGHHAVCGSNRPASVGRPCISLSSWPDEFHEI